MRRFALASMLVAATGVAMAQSPATDATAAFDVASVKRNTSAQLNWGYGTRPGGQFVATNTPLRELIVYAFDIHDVQLIGAPGWLDDRFDIIAKTGEAGDPPESEVRERMRALLADRFRLAIHHETRESTMYALVMAHADGAFGPALHHAEIDCTNLPRGAKPPAPTSSRPVCGMLINPASMTAGGVSMAELANSLAARLDSVVVDKTDLAGGYDFDVTFAPDVSAPDRPSDLPSLFTALQEQLGLKLQSQRGPIDVVVIDHVEPPGDN